MYILKIMYLVMDMKLTRIGTSYITYCPDLLFSSKTNLPILYILFYDWEV